MKIYCKLISGNFSESVSIDDFAEVFRAAIEREYPDANVEIDIQNASGSGHWYSIDGIFSDDLNDLADEVFSTLL